MTSSFLTSIWLTYFLFVTKVALKNLHFCNNLSGRTVCLIFVFHAFSSDFKCVLHDKIVQCRFLIRIPLLLENLLFSFDEWYIWMAVAINIARIVLIGKIFLNKAKYTHLFKSVSYRLKKWSCRRKSNDLWFKQLSLFRSSFSLSA